MKSSYPQGQLLGRHSQDFGKTLYVAIVFGALCVASLFGWLLVYEEILAQMVFIANMFLFMGTLVALFTAFRPASVFEVYTDGFVMKAKRTDKPKSYATWREVVIVPQHINTDASRTVGVAVGGLLGGLIFGLISSAANRSQGHDQTEILQFYMPNGRIFRTNISYDQYAQMQAAIKYHYIQYWTNYVHAALNNGQPIVMNDDLQVTPQGLVAKRTPVAWGQFVSAKWTTGKVKRLPTPVLELSYMRPDKKKPAKIQHHLGYQGDVLLTLMTRTAPQMRIG